MTTFLKFESSFNLSREGTGWGDGRTMFTTHPHNAQSKRAAVVAQKNQLVRTKNNQQ